MSPYIRTVKTASGATAVQVVWSEHRGSKKLQQVGSGHSPDQVEQLKAQARRLIDVDQLTLDLGVEPSASRGTADDPVPVTAQRAGYLLDCIDACFNELGLAAATGDDPVFRDLVRARLINPGSKFDSIETLAEVGVTSASYATIKRRLPGFATDAFGEGLTQVLAHHAGIGPGIFVLYDVTTLYFETDTPDELRKPGFSKERRLEPQILVGLLTDATGFPLHVGAFAGNSAETHTMLPMITRFQEAYQLDEVTVVADAGMFSAANKQALIDAGLHYILSVKTPTVPEVIETWRRENPGDDYTHGQIWTQASASDGRKHTTPNTVTHYQYSHDRARRSLRGIKEQVAKAKRAVDGDIAIKRNRYIDLCAPNKKVNYALAAKHRALAGIKGYETDLTALAAQEVIGHYRRLFNIEKSFRMSKSDLKARPIYARKQDSITAHLNIVIAALAVAHLMETRSGQSIKRLVRTLKKYRSFELNIGGETIHAAVPLPPEIQTLVNTITAPTLRH
ncbi:IS1634 family transposase [Corynebacterium minutissimum]